MSISIGFIGRSVYKNSSNTFKMPKITSLDPGEIFFTYILILGGFEAINSSITAFSN